MHVLIIHVFNLSFVCIAHVQYMIMTQWYLMTKMILCVGAKASLIH